MNRLLRIGFDILLTSITPILGWFLLGILVDKNLINIFTLIYPMQFVITTIQSIFGTGANISAIKDNNPNSAFSGIICGSILGFIILFGVIINIDDYISFMNMDINTYRIFAIYAVAQMFLQLLLRLSLCKLYYENKNKIANKYSIYFNLLNFISLIVMSIVTKNQIQITSISFLITAIFVLIMMVKTVHRTKFKINIIKCIKYDSAYLFGEISMFIIYLFGLKNSFDFGEKYILAISFLTLITDTQWDIADSIKIVAQIDIAKKVFSYKDHIKNSRKLVYMLITSSIIMGFILYPIYKVDLSFLLIITGIELICIYVYPIYLTKLTYIQLEISAYKATIHKQIANIFRIACSFIPSPFCLSIGLASSVTYQLISSTVITDKYLENNKLDSLVSKG